MAKRITSSNTRKAGTFTKAAAPSRVFTRETFMHDLKKVAKREKGTASQPAPGKR